MQAPKSFLLAISLVVAGVSSQNLARGQAGSQGATLQAELLKGIDASHARVGDEVTARTVTQLEVGGTKYPSGTIVQGHITQIGSDRFAVLFDHLVMKKSPAVSASLSLRAIMMPHGATPGRPAAGSDQMSPQSQSLGGSRDAPGLDSASSGNMMRSPHAAARDAADTTFKGPQNSSQPQVTETRSGGVIGLPGVHLEINGDPALGSTFEFDNGSKAHIDKGLQLMFVVAQL